MKNSRFKLRINKEKDIVITLSHEDAEQMLASANEHTGCWDPDDEWTEYFEQLTDDMRKALKKVWSKAHPPQQKAPVVPIVSEETKQLVAKVRDTPNSTTRRALADIEKGNVKKFANCNELYKDLGII